MEDLIKTKLREIEKAHDIRILYACESGSRAWGFPSPNSDYDVRFIYAQGLDWHLSLADRKDTLDFPINDKLDIGGWEISKALRLLWKSNAPILEWLQSPIVYHANQEFLSSMQVLAKECFSPISTMHHYLSMSKKYVEACEGEKVKLKKYFYALRTTVSGVWIRERGLPPHIEMPAMFDVVDSEIRSRIVELIAIKAVQNEDYLHPQQPVILGFLKDAVLRNEEAFSSLPSGKGDFDELEAFYRKIVKGNI